MAVIYGAVGTLGLPVSGDAVIAGSAPPALFCVVGPGRAQGGLLGSEPSPSGEARGSQQPLGLKSARGCFGAAAWLLNHHAGYAAGTQNLRSCSSAGSGSCLPASPAPLAGLVSWWGRAAPPGGSLGAVGQCSGAPSPGELAPGFHRGDLFQHYRRCTA